MRAVGEEETIMIGLFDLALRAPRDGSVTPKDDWKQYQIRWIPLARPEGRTKGCLSGRYNGPTTCCLERFA